MTSTRANNPPAPGPEPGHTPKSPRSPWERVSLAIQLVLSLAVAGGVLAYLIWSGARPPAPKEEERPKPPDEVVRVAGPRSISVRPGTPLDDKLQVATVQARQLSAPVLPVTGTALASLRPGREDALPVFAAAGVGLAAGPSAAGPLPAVVALVAGAVEAKDAWQFATPELLTTFADWQKAVTDIQFQENQLRAIRDLNDSRVAAQQKVVDRMEKLVAAGTDTQKDLAVERTNLLLSRIQGRKEVHEAETAVRLARRTEATLARQLQQAGLEPTMLRSAAAEGRVVVAEVPEQVTRRVRLGMTCAVRFYALPKREFTGKVSGIAPVISKDRRVLNVQFVVKDPEEKVLPGMFAEIGLGTDERRGLLMPADGLLHIGDNDYALRADGPHTWRITEVQVGELQGADVEVLEGLKAGDRVLGKGAILLKPVVVRALQVPPTVPTGVATSSARGGGR
jgi:hypothetical protein